MNHDLSSQEKLVLGSKLPVRISLTNHYLDSPILKKYPTLGDGIFFKFCFPEFSFQKFFLLLKKTNTKYNQGNMILNYLTSVFFLQQNCAWTAGPSLKVPSFNIIDLFVFILWFFFFFEVFLLF